MAILVFSFGLRLVLGSISRSSIGIAAVQIRGLVVLAESRKLKIDFQVHFSGLHLERLSDLQACTRSFRVESACNHYSVMLM